MTAVSQYTHDTVPTQFVEADGIRFAYRRFGTAGAAPPLVLVQHFRGNLDNHDPAITNRLAQDREVILFDNTGVGQSTGQAADTIEGMALTRRRSLTPWGWTRSTSSATRWAAT